MWTILERMDPETITMGTQLNVFLLIIEEVSDITGVNITLQNITTGTTCQLQYTKYCSMEGPIKISRGAYWISLRGSTGSQKQKKMYRCDYSRKSSRVLTNTDIMNRLLISSDPYLSSMCLLKKTVETLTRAPLTLL